jgi:ribosomal protein L17
VTDPAPEPWDPNEPDRIDTHADRLEQLHRRIEELLMAQEDSTEADRIAEERMREANSELLRRLTEQVEANGGHKG